MDLREALTQIHEIRQQVARTETFRGYRAAPIAFSGVVALVGAVCQTVLVPNPAGSLDQRRHKSFEPTARIKKLSSQKRNRLEVYNCHHHLSLTSSRL